MTQHENESGEDIIAQGNAADLLNQAIALLIRDDIYIAAAHVQEALDYLTEREIAGS